MKLLLTTLFLCSVIISTTVIANKDSAIIQAPDGSKMEVRVPKEAVKEVRQTGPNEYEVKIDKNEMKKIEVKPISEKPKN